MRRLFLTTSALLIAVFLSACGRGTPKGQTEEQIVQDLVTSAPDIATKQSDAKSLFAAGSLPKPAELKKIAAAGLIPDRPRISGDQATVSVSVRSQGEKELGKVEWVLVKEQDQWKIKSAPLP